MMELTTDIVKINSVLKHPYIWPRVSDKRQNIDEFEPPIKGINYLYEEGVLFILHPLEDKLQIHANVIPEYRDKAESAAKEALRYGFIDLKASEIVAKIPEKYDTVYHFAVKFMKDVGFANGNHLLSLRVEEWDL